MNVFRNVTKANPGSADLPMKKAFPCVSAVGFLLLAALILTGCSPRSAATIPFIPLERTATWPARSPTAANLLYEATETPLPSKMPSLTATAYMDIDFSKVEIYQGGFLSDFRYFVSFQFPGDVQGEYHALVDKNKEYKCTVLPDYPDRLYCSGPLVVVYNWARIDLYADDIGQPVWSGKFFVPKMN